LQIIHYDDNGDDDDDDDEDADSDKSSAATVSATSQQLSPSTPGSISGSESCRPLGVVATPPGHVTSVAEGLRRGLGVPVVPSRLTNLLPSVSSSSTTSPVAVTPSAAAAMPLSLVPILAVVDVAGSTIVPAMTPLLVQRSRDYQDGETIDLSTKGRRRRATDNDDEDDVDGGDDVGAAVPLVKVPRCQSNSDDDDQSAPLNLSMPRDSAPRDPGASSSYRVLCEWDATDDSARTDDAADIPPVISPAHDSQGTSSQATSSQILLLSGKQYEIVPLGDGRWISRSEYELQRGLQKSSSGVELVGGVRPTVDSKSCSYVENTGTSGELPSPSTSSVSAAAAGGGGTEGRKDEELEKMIVGPDEVSSTIVTESETSEVCKDDDDDEGRLRIVEDVTSEHGDDDDDDGDGDGDMKTEKAQEQSDDKGTQQQLLTKHVRDPKDTTATTTTTTSTTTTATTVAVDDGDKCIDIISSPRPLPTQ